MRLADGYAFFGEAGGTRRWQPIDNGFGLAFARGISARLQKWHRKHGLRKAVNKQQQRLLALQWVGEVADDWESPSSRHLREACWRHTGAVLTASGDGDRLVKPEGVPGYVPPPVGTTAKQ